jgi:hypothetical protein
MKVCKPSVLNILQMTLCIVFISCRTSTGSDLTGQEDSQKIVTLNQFTYDLDPQLFSEVAKRTGCAAAQKWVATPKLALTDIIRQLRLQTNPYRFLKENVFDSYSVPCPKGDLVSNSSGIQGLHRLVTSKGYNLAVVIVGGFGSHLTDDGALSDSRQLWASSLPAESFSAHRVECLPNSFATDDVCVPSVRKSIQQIMAREKKQTLYLIWGYSKGGSVALQLLAEEPEIREKVLALVTLAAPFGGGLPAKSVSPLIDEIDRLMGDLSDADRLLLAQLMMLQASQGGATLSKSVSDDALTLLKGSQLKQLRDGFTSLLPSNRYRFLKDRVAKWNLSRTRPHPILNSLSTLVYHVSAIVDLATLKPLPTPYFDADDRLALNTQGLNSMHSVESLLAFEFRQHPLSDMCIALEHSVIPKEFAPKGADIQMLGLLKVDHVANRLSNEGYGDKEPTVEIVDGIMAAITQKLRGLSK